MGALNTRTTQRLKAVSLRTFDGSSPAVAKLILPQVFSMARHGRGTGDPVIVEFVGLTTSARHDRSVSRQVEPKEVEDPESHAGGIGAQVLITHQVRLDVVRGKPVAARSVVFVDGPDEGVDLFEVESGFVSGRSGVPVLPEMRLVCAGPRHRCATVSSRRRCTERVMP